VQDPREEFVEPAIGKHEEKVAEVTGQVASGTDQTDGAPG
jgi:hypothetical protein